MYVFVLFTESKHYFLLARRSTWPRLSCALPLEFSEISIALQCKSTSITNTLRIEFFNETKEVHYNYKLTSEAITEIDNYSLSVRDNSYVAAKKN